LSTDVTAFALGGGGAHGDFELGALQYFYGWGLTPAIICGTSVGSLNGIKLAEGENAPGSTASAPSGLAGLTAIWNGLQTNDEMWSPAPWQAQIENNTLVQFMQAPGWAQGAAVAGELFVGALCPLAGVLDARIARQGGRREDRGPGSEFVVSIGGSAPPENLS
jgi:predicted acylesterase/phospholipase RssA